MRKEVDVVAWMDVQVVISGQQKTDSVVIVWLQGKTV